MNVYITYCKDGYGGSTVDEVYLDKDKVIQKVIETKLRVNSYYKDYGENELKIEAEKYIETVVVSE